MKSQEIWVMVRSAKDKRQKEKTCMLYTIFILALHKLKKRQKDIHPAQTQHNTQQ
jgi:hypothetical protein